MLPSDLGQTILKLCWRAGLTRKQFCFVAGIGEDDFQRMQSDSGLDFDIITLERISMALAVPLADLVDIAELCGRKRDMVLLPGWDLDFQNRRHEFETLRQEITWRRKKLTRSRAKLAAARERLKLERIMLREHNSAALEKVRLWQGLI